MVGALIGVTTAVMPIVKPKPVLADNPVVIAPICDFVHSVTTVNNSRDHWDGEQEYGIDNSPGYAIDFGVQGVSGAPETVGQPYGNAALMCANSNVYAAFSGVVTHAYDSVCQSYYAVLTNTDLNLHMNYIHLSITASNGQTVTAGQKIGNAGAIGCANSYVHNHIILKRTDYSTLTYSSQYTTEYPNQWEFGNVTQPTSTTLRLFKQADYDGDGKADLSVKTNTGFWGVDYAANGFGGWDFGLSAYGDVNAIPLQYRIKI